MGLPLDVVAFAFLAMWLLPRHGWDDMGRRHGHASVAVAPVLELAWPCFISGLLADRVPIGMMYGE